MVQIKSTWNSGSKELIGRGGRSTFATVEVQAPDTEVQGQIVPALKAALTAMPPEVSVYLTETPPLSELQDAFWEFVVQGLGAAVG